MNGLTFAEIAVIIFAAIAMFVILSRIALYLYRLLVRYLPWKDWNEYWIVLIFRLILLLIFVGLVLNHAQKSNL